MFKYSVPTQQKTHGVTIIKRNQLLMCKEVYSENHMNHINTVREQNTGFIHVEAVDGYSFHCAFTV